MKARDPYLDVARGIGILLVLLWHSHCLHIFSYLINMCFLPLFFVITGYLCSQQLDIQNIQIFQYAKDRAKRILIPYLKYNIILLGFYCVQVLVTDEVFNVNYLFGIVYSRYYILSDGVRLMSMSDICNAQLWFLPCMYLVSVLFYYIQKVQNDLSVVMTMLFFIALTVLFSFLPVLLPWSLDTLPICIIFCEFGMLIKNLKLLDSRLYGWKTILSTTMLGILYFILNYSFQRQSER